jgi:hypothetical protein
MITSDLLAAGKFPGSFQKPHSSAERSGTEKSVNRSVGRRIN